MRGKSWGEDQNAGGQPGVQGFIKPDQGSVMTESSCHAGRKKVGEVWCIGRSGEAQGQAPRLPWRAMRSEKLTRVGGSVHITPPALRHCSTAVSVLMHAAGDWLLLYLVGSLVQHPKLPRPAMVPCWICRAGGWGRPPGYPQSGDDTVMARLL